MLTLMEYWDIVTLRYIQGICIVHAMKLLRECINFNTLFYSGSVWDGTREFSCCNIKPIKKPLATICAWICGLTEDFSFRDRDRAR